MDRSKGWIAAFVLLGMFVFAAKSAAEPPPPGPSRTQPNVEMSIPQPPPGPGAETTAPQPEPQPQPQSTIAPTPSGDVKPPLATGADPPPLRPASKTEPGSNGAAHRPLPEPPLEPSSSGTTTYTLIALLLGIGIGAVACQFYLSWRLRVVERGIAKALRLERITVAEVANEILELQTDFVEEIKKRETEHSRQTKELSTRLAVLDSQRGSRPALGPDQTRSAAAIACVDDALNAMGAPDTRTVDEAIGLHPALESTKTFLEELQKGPTTDFAAKLLTGLERGQLDHALSTASLLDTYFADRPAFRHARVAYRALESLLLALLHNHGVQVIRPSILSVISAADIPSGQSGDRRNVRNVQTIRQTAARVARSLEPSEFLIVDCPAPGWMSSGPIGRRQPHIAIFETSSWT